ncbi:PEP-CTERM sorting domain-containing protein [Rhodocyclus purpureus]|uniref:PEP-CTERM sorting domain-containing protein n=1 Tax=Rhodocyclus purpureus TaxID=1067 RepID=UPI001912F215|nr:PEP-CTERM sorting domain-containing protein [Rhodocyclus purpureus]
MKTIKKSVLALAIASALVSGSANAYVSYFLDPDGAGGTAPVYVREWLDIMGTLYVDNTFSSPTTFTFYQQGTAEVVGANGIGKPTLLNIGVKFYGPGNGALAGAGGNITFTGGKIEVYSDYGLWTKQIASFDIIGNGGSVDGNAVPNGKSTLVGKATYLDPGYWRTAVNSTTPGGALGAESTFGFSTTDLSQVEAGSQQGVLDMINVAYGTNYTAPVSAEDLILSANGQWRMSLPEPASLALVALGLLGMGTLRRRRST